MLFQYDALILKLSRNLIHKNDLLMDKDDILQYGRIEALKALSQYDQCRNTQPITLVYCHLVRSFSRLFYKSISNRFTGVKKHLKELVRSKSYSTIMSGKTIDFESSDLTYELDFDNLQFKIEIDKLCKTDKVFKSKWDEFLSLQDKVMEINKRINFANSSNSGGVNLLVHSRNNIYDQIDIIEKYIKSMIVKTGDRS